MTHVGVRFGDCELSVERLELRRVDKVVDMEPQVFDVLAYLLRHRERVVPKTELLDQIWDNRFVSESALSSRIKSARRAVGDSGRDQRIIKTIHGRGYRFVADVIEKPRFAGSTNGSAATHDPAGSWQCASSSSPRRSIRVQVLLLDVITLQGMIAHNRGEWFDRLRRGLRATGENPQLASTVFDSHLCVAEYLLYGPTPYDEVICLTRQLREQAERTGARRGVAFAVTVAGEAALLAGDLDAARADLTEAVALHAEMGADTGTAHTLQRLAEVELAGDDPAAAERLLRRALPLARWSSLARHLLQRIYGTLISAAPDADAALAVVDEAVERLDEPFACTLCQVMIAVPASIACIEGGRLDEARSWLARAQSSAATWQGTAWQGAVAEARAHLARAEGDRAAANRLLADAAKLFEVAGQPLDAQRCLEAVDS